MPTIMADPLPPDFVSISLKIRKKMMEVLTFLDVYELALAKKSLYITHSDYIALLFSLLESEYFECFLVCGSVSINLTPFPLVTNHLYLLSQDLNLESLKVEPTRKHMHVSYLWSDHNEQEKK